MTHVCRLHESKHCMHQESISVFSHRSSNQRVLRLPYIKFHECLSGYNQIRMDPLDAPKIASVSNHDNYYYNITPFGLKNVGVTY